MDLAEGAGTNDAVLTGKDVAISGYINNSTLQFNLGTEFPWYLELDFEDYTGKKQHPLAARSEPNHNGFTDTLSPEWSSVQVNPGPPTEGFAIKENKLVYKGDLDFKGWLGEFSHPLAHSDKAETNIYVQSAIGPMACPSCSGRLGCSRRRLPTVFRSIS